jgi:hypothetical protein
MADTNPPCGSIGSIRVVSLDIYIGATCRNLSEMDPQVRGVDHPALLPLGARCLVVEDSAHVSETTFASLTLLCLLPVGGHFVVEHGYVGIERIRLARGSRLSGLPWLELYRITCHPDGFLQRPALEAS